MSPKEIELELRRLSGLIDHHQDHVLGTNWTGLGALLVVAGALLVLGDALIGPALTWAGTLPKPRARFTRAAALTGSVLVLCGSAVLLVQAGASFAALIVVAAGASIAILGLMTWLLRAHINSIAAETPGVERRSLWWCLRHLKWEPGDAI